MADDDVAGLTGVTGVNGVNGNGSVLGFVELELGLAGVMSCWALLLFMVGLAVAVASSRSRFI